ncbi:MAG: hypothetical protein M1821_004146 [Bathelium mastoideum]|nr:MAG: hypothetical protein M1821_004146 [Bathelium mastoideum]KAI9691218.1 MAG: hypothetical protein M1822_008838 [Bathelium mastoideum]
MAGDLVLISGATGHLGFRTLVLALEAGYQVRAAIRNESRAQEILETPSIKRLNTGSNLTFVTVPDLTSDGAYDEAVKGVKYIIHLASPITSGKNTQPDQYEAVYISPAVHGTLGMLESAHRAGPTVRRIVIASSVLSLASLQDLSSGANTVTATSRVRPTPALPTTPGAAEFVPYAISKIAALNAAEDWIQQHDGTTSGRATFDLVHIHPSFVLGANELATTVRAVLGGTNAAAATLALGARGGADEPRLGASVHLEDVAEAHVRALQPEVAGNQSFVVSTPGGIKWEDTLEVVERVFPEAVADGRLPNNGAQKTGELNADVAKTEEVLGIRFRGFEEQVKSVVGQLLEVADREGQREELESVKREFAKA